MTQDMGWLGYAPTVLVSNIRPEEKKIYEKMWDTPEYRQVSPGEKIASEFLMQAKPKPGAKVIDLGCGTGRGGLMLAVLGQMDVTYVDFAVNCLDEDIRPMLESQKHCMRFVEHDLTKPVPMQAEYGFCTDVMEHIPEADVDKVLDNCLLACQHVFFQIATVEDFYGPDKIGMPLHLTVKPFEWWLKKFNARECVIHWSKNDGPEALFYVSAWTPGVKITEAGELNIAEEKCRANVRHNIAQGWTQVVPHEANDVECMILGGGPTAAEFIDVIKEKRAEGAKLICLNGAYQWALDNGLTPSAMVMVDARPFNARFTKPVVDGCKYFLASQCDPSAFDGMPDDRTYIWHTMTALIGEDLTEYYKDGVWYGVPGGSTVLLRTIPLFRMLGFKKFHLFGCDSCIIEDKHHGYSQPENDGQQVLPIIVGGRVFKCTTWMASQCNEFLELIKFLGDEVELEVYGDGLLAWCLKSGAELYDLEFLNA